MKDFFICHASEDKESFVRSFAEALRGEGFAIWYDEFEITIGDSLMEKITSGLNDARYGIIVLSKSFFRKTWTQRELSALFVLEEMNSKKRILPLWHNVTKFEVAEYNPILADRVAWVTADSSLFDLVKKFRIFVQ